MKRLLIHVGLPKTGTTAMQRWCYTHRSELESSGVFYPEQIADPVNPNHHFLVSGLSRNELDRDLPAVLAHEAQTVYLSAEGLSILVDNFPPDALSRFRELCAGRTVEVLVFFRNPEDWIVSYWKQYLVNPQDGPSRDRWVVPGTAAGAPRSRDVGALTLSEFSLQPRVQELLDRTATMDRLGSAFGAQSVIEAQYEEGWANVLGPILGIQIGGEAQARRARVSMSDELADLVRRINGLGLSVDLRNRLLAALALQQSEESSLRVAAELSYRKVLDPSLTLGSVGELLHWARAERGRVEGVVSLAEEVCDRVLAR